MNASSSQGVTEAMLLRWSDNHNGRTVTFQLPADGEHPFRGLKCGPTNGQRLALSVVLIADDETTADHVAQRTEQRSSTSTVEGSNPSVVAKSYAQRAAMLCNDPVFWRFLLESPSFHGCFTPEETDVLASDDGSPVAIEGLRSACGIESRRELIEGTEAGQKFLDLVAEFKGWKTL